MAICAKGRLSTNPMPACVGWRSAAPSRGSIGSPDVGLKRSDTAVMKARTPEHVDLFHGTSATEAHAIAAGGFKAVDADAVVARVAAAHKLTGERLWAHMTHAWGKGRIGDEHVYFTTHPERAASYARRGSEVAHFALRAAYAVLNHGDPNSRDAQEWAKARAAHAGVPAVVHLRAPAAELERVVRHIPPRGVLPPELECRMAHELMLRVPIAHSWPVRVLRAEHGARPLTAPRTADPPRYPQRWHTARASPQRSPASACVSTAQYDPFLPPFSTTLVTNPSRSRAQSAGLRCIVTRFVGLSTFTIAAPPATASSKDDSSNSWVIRRL